MAVKENKAIEAAKGRPKGVNGKYKEREIERRSRENGSLAKWKMAGVARNRQESAGIGLDVSSPSVSFMVLYFHFRPPPLINGIYDFRPALGSQLSKFSTKCKALFEGEMKVSTVIASQLANSHRHYGIVSSA